MSPGEYNVSAFVKAAGYGQFSSYGSEKVSVLRRDAADVKIQTLPGQSLKIAAILEGDPPSEPLHIGGLVNLESITTGTNVTQAKLLGLPTESVLDSIAPDDYAMRYGFTAQSVYVKDITYNGLSIIHQPLHIGVGGPSTVLRMVISRDGATVSCAVSDRDGKVLPDVNVLVFPSNLQSIAMLPDVWQIGSTDLNGRFTSRTLPPGKYTVVATLSPVEGTPETVMRVWNSRRKGTEVEVGPNGSASVSLSPISFD